MLSAPALDLSILENCEDRITGFTGTGGGTASVPSHGSGPRRGTALPCCPLRPRTFRSWRIVKTGLQDSPGRGGGTASVPSHDQGRDEARPSHVVRSRPGPFDPVHLVHPVKNPRRIVPCGSSQGRMKSEP